MTRPMAAREIRDVARTLTPKDWHDLLMKSGTNDEITLDGMPLPKFPPTEVQMRLNGRPASQSMPAALALYRYSMAAFDAAGFDRKTSSYLDFGAGWGRIWRYFLRDFYFERCLAYDVNPKLQKLWSDVNISGNIRIGKAYHPLPFEPHSLTLVTSNSVWSHLSENLAKDSLAKLRLVMKKNGIVVLTTFGIKHLTFFKKIQDGEVQNARMALRNLPVDMAEMIKLYEKGKFTFIPTGKNEDLIEYELAAIPRKWFEENLTGFVLEDYTDDILPQTLVRLRAV
jgi:hypothetical protein